MVADEEPLKEGTEKKIASFSAERKSGSEDEGKEEEKEEKEKEEERKRKVCAQTQHEQQF